MKYIKGLIFILIIANIVLSAYLLYIDFSNKPISCFTGEGCSIIKNSPYSYTFGIKNSIIGTITFSILFIIYFLDYKNKIPKYIFPIISTIGAILAIRFLYIQFFIIGSVCSNCLIADSIAIIIAALSIYNYSEERAFSSSVE